MSASTDPTTVHRRLWQLRREGRAEEAWRHLEAALPFALAAEPRDREQQRLLLDAWINSALPGLRLEPVLTRLGQQVALQGLPDDKPELETLLEQSRLAGELPTATSALVQLLVLEAGQPGEAQRALELAENLALQGQLQLALQLCLDALGHLPLALQSRGHDLAALLTYRLGDRNTCYRHLFEAVALGSQDPLTLQFLCRLQCQRGDLDAAAASLERIQQQQIGAFGLREKRLELGLDLATGLLGSGRLERLYAGLGGGLYEDGAELLALAPSVLDQESEVLALRDALLRNRNRQFAGRRRGPGPEASGDPVQQQPTTRVQRLGVLAPGYGPLSPGAMVRALEPWLRAEGLELHWFANLANDDDRGATEATITNLAGLDTGAATALLRQRQLDGLIDLCGWSDGQRHDVLRERVAPLQLGWFNQELSLGLPELDYLLVDRFQEPPLREALMEGLLVLPGSFLALAEPLPPVPLRPVVGGALAVLAPPCRIQQGMLAAWAELLRTWPELRIGFLHAGYGQGRVWGRLLEAMAAEGIAAERLVRLSGTPEAWPTALLLDPWPWGNWQAVLAALQQGIPVVCRQGPALHQRRSAGVLELLGLGAFVAEDAENYVAIADTLLADAQLQAQLQELIPQQLKASLLHQPAQFARDLNSCLQSLS